MEKSIENIIKKDIKTITGDDVFALINTLVTQAQVIAEKENALIAKEQAIAEKDKKIKALETEIAEIKELRRLANARRYSPSTEQTPFLFPELEAVVNNMDPSDDEEEELVKAYKRKRVKRNKCTAPATTPVVDIFHDENAASVIEKDGIKYERMEDKIVEKVAFIPSKLVVERHHYPQYRPVCEEEKKIVLYEHKETDTCAASPSFIANVVVNKFDDHLPLYRQEEIFERDGYYFSRQKMATWLIKYYDLLSPLLVVIKDEIYHSAFLNKDETPVQVLDVKNAEGKPSSNCFMHVTIGSSYNEKERNSRSLVLYEYSNGRTKDILVEDYNRYNYSGYVMTDGLKGYNLFEASRHATCHVHAIRQMKNILSVNKKNIHAKKMVMLFNKLYQIEDKYRTMLSSGEIDANTFLIKRKEEATAVIDEMFKMLGEFTPYYSQESAMGKAIRYFYQYKDNLYVYLNCSRV